MSETRYIHMTRQMQQDYEVGYFFPLDMRREAGGGGIECEVYVHEDVTPNAICRDCGLMGQDYDLAETPCERSW